MVAIHLLGSLLAILLGLGSAIALRSAEAYPHPSAAILLGLTLGEVGLVATWSACARRSWMARAAIAWASAALAAWPLSLCSGPSWSAWAGLLLVYCLTIAAVWKLLLAAGYRWSGLAEAAPAAPDRLQPHQFSLAWLMQAMTACALALGIGSWLTLPPAHTTAAVVSLALFGMFVPLTIGTLLVDTPRWWLRVALGMFVPLGGGVLMLVNPGQHALLLVLAFGVQTLVVLLAATVLASVGVALQPVTAPTTPRGPAPTRLSPAGAL
jgi:hypothetical protein